MTVEEGRSAPYRFVEVGRPLPVAPCLDIPGASLRVIVMLVRSHRAIYEVGSGQFR